MSLLILGFHVPSTHLESVKLALFNAGAGTIGNYEQASWQTKGIGQFKPLPGAKPYLGQIDELEVVEEFKVETVCEESQIKTIIEALKLSHPYEKPWYYVLRPLSGAEIDSLSI